MRLLHSSWTVAEMQHLLQYQHTSQVNYVASAHSLIRCKFFKPGQHCAPLFTIVSLGYIVQHCARLFPDTISILIVA